MSDIVSIDELFHSIQSRLHTESDYEQFQQHLQQFHELQKSETTKQSIISHIVADFLSDNMIYYNKTSKIYFNYINDHYVLVNEDNMIHHVLDYISHFKAYRNEMNVSLKMMVKNKIIKSIKETNIHDAIPDTDTIQTILTTLFPHMFTQKEYCKIFLLMIGMIVLKKRPSQKCIMFMRNEFKPILNDINKYITLYFCSHNIFNYFKFKYTQDHIGLQTWMVPCHPISYDMYHFTEQFYVNLICVSIYYANRYEDIDQYLESVVGDISHVYERVHFLNVQSREHIAQGFMNQYMIQKSGEYMDQKDVLFLWKRYVSEKDLFVHPFTSYQDFLITIFQHTNQEYNEDNNHNCIQGYCSMEIPAIDLFRDFWNDHFVFCEDEYYFEMSEILHLFHQAHKQKKLPISESTIVLILQSYYTQYPIINGKAVHNVKCDLWNKKKEIDLFVEKEKINVKNNAHTLYKKYSEYQKEKSIKISKKYFTMYMDQLRSMVPPTSPSTSSH